MDENQIDASHEKATSETTDVGIDENIEEETLDVKTQGEEGTVDETGEVGEASEETKGPMPPYTEDDPTIRRFNMTIAGVVTLHYPARDVAIQVDGDAGLRLLAMFQRRSDARWKDHLDPRWALATNGWLVLDLTQPLAISYLPLGQPNERTAIDPVLVA